MEKRKPHFLAPIFLVLFSITLTPREKEIRFEHVSLDQGLSQSSIYCITQDRQGFLWTGSEDGINKYDGVTFITYRSPHTASDAERVSAYISMTADRNGILWLGTFGRGMERFDPRYESFKLFISAPSRAESLCGNFVWAFAQDADDQLWIGTDNGLNCLNTVSEQIKSYRAQPGIPGKLNSPYIYSLCLDRAKRRLWIGTMNGGLNMLDIHSSYFTAYSRPQTLNAPAVASPPIKSVFQDSWGLVWAGMLGGGLDCWNPDTKAFKHYQHDAGDPRSLSDNNIRVIFEDRERNLWIGSDKGLNLFHRASGAFTRYQEDLGNLYSLSRNQVRAIFQDQSGTLWIGTLMGGLNKYSSEKERFNHYRSLPGPHPSLSSDAVFSLWEENEDVLWIGTFNGGLNRFDRRQNHFSHFRHHPQNPRSLSSDNVWAVFIDNRGVIWAGTDKGLNRFHPETADFTRHLTTTGGQATQNENVYAINEDKNGALWVGSQNGLHRLSADRLTVDVFKNDPRNPDSLSHNNIRAIYRDSQDNLWIGSFGGGLNRLRVNGAASQSVTFERFIHQANNPHSLSSNFIYSITQDREGFFWIGTRGAGVARLNPQTGQFSRLGVENGLAGNVVYGILKDKRGNLWCSTNQGLSRLNPRSLMVKNYDRRDGLQSNEFNMGSYHYSRRTGEMFFGGINGFNAFFPDEIKDSAFSPPIVISELKIFNRPVHIGETIEGTKILNRGISDTQEITLSYLHTVFSIRYAALHFVSPERNRYKYQMEGVDDSWTETSDTTATFAHLPPKTYTFKVMGTNKDGVWSREAASLEIIISPPFYKTWWFYALLLVIFTGGLFGFLYLRDQQQRRQERKLSRLVKERTEELEKVNNIVKSINSKVELEQLLHSIVNEAIDLRSGYEATILVHSHNEHSFYEMARLGGPSDPHERKALSHEWVEEHYIQNANEISDDIFLTTSENSRHRLVIRVRVDKHVEGYIIFESEEDEPVFEHTNIQLLKNLKDHIASAFIKDKLLYELHEAKKKAENERREAEAANRYKSDFLARMSHEIRTPMNSIIGFSDLLLETRLEEGQYDFTRTIRHSAEALLTIINEILDLSRIEAGRFFLEPSEFSPELLAFSICELLTPKTSEKSLEILCSAADNLPPTVIGDQGRFRQVLINLMSNAVKFTHSGEIELRLRVDERDGERIRITASVRDTGIGIRGDHLEQIFEPFQQADISNTRKYDGAGLGLSICKEIAHLMNGEITVESNPGEGSTFYFTAWMGDSGQSPEPLPHYGVISGKRALVADDNSRCLEILTEILHSMNAVVTPAASGAAALESVERAQTHGIPFDLAIIDVHMPGLNGYETARRIRALLGDSHRIPILALASTIERRSREFLKSEFDGFLPKPVQKQRLLEKLQRLMKPGNENEEPATDAASPHETGHAATTADEPSDSTAQKNAFNNKTIQPVNGVATTPPNVSPNTETAPAANTPRKYNILLAEDNPVNKKLIHFIISRLGDYSLEIVEDGRKLLDVMRQRPSHFDLILMDIQMPEIDGMQATAILRKEGITLPIIAMTASSMRGDREKFLAAGMNDYLAKPVNKEQIILILKKWLRQ